MGRCERSSHGIVLGFEAVEQQVALLGEVAHHGLTHHAHCLLVRILDVVKLLLAHDGLSDVQTVHVAPVADVPEAEVQVVAVQAHPVAHSLG